MVSFTSDQLMVIYRKHINVIRTWANRESDKCNSASDEALAALRRPVVSLIIWDLWMNTDHSTLTVKQELLAGLWKRSREEIDRQAEAVAKKSRNLGSLAERVDDLKQRFFQKFEELMAGYDARLSRMSTYLKTPAFNFFLNCLKSDDRARRIVDKYQDKVFVPADGVTEAVDWFSSNQPEQLEWIESTLRSLEEDSTFSREKIEVFRLRYFAGKRIEEVAIEIGRSTGFVSNSGRLVEAALSRLARKSRSEGGYYE